MTILLAFLAALSLAACSSPDSPAPDGGMGGAGLPADDAGPADAGADAEVDADAGPCALVRPYSTKDAICNACAEASCCAEINGCLVDPACDDGYVNCAIACSLDPDAGQDPCLADCAAQYPGGQAEYDTAIGCADAKCAVECQ